MFLEVILISLEHKLTISILLEQIFLQSEEKHEPKDNLRLKKISWKSKLTSLKFYMK